MEEKATPTQQGPQALVVINLKHYRPFCPVSSKRHADSRATARLAALATLTTLSALLACDTPEAPAVCGALPQQMITVGESATVTACFDDPHGSTLAYEFWSSDPGVVTVAGWRAKMTVTAVSLATRW